MAVNMPHEGGLETLGIIFGTRPKDNTFTVMLWTGLPPLGVDYDDADTVDGVATTSAEWILANAIQISDTPANYEAGTLSGEVATSAMLQAKISLVDNVPQVEFPQYGVTFSSGFTDLIHGYAVVGSGDSALDGTGATIGKVYFREKFTTPFSPAGMRLIFIPTLRLGNTTAPLS